MLINGTGCALMDYLYNHVDFNSRSFQDCLSRSSGDGGLTPGGLVFAEELEQFTDCSFQETLHSLVGSRPPDGENLGGPAIVALVHAAQLLRPGNDQVCFFGARGDDEGSAEMLRIIGQTPLQVGDFSVKPGPTPSTVVLSDPNYLDGKGERTFINTIGAAKYFSASDLDESFFKADLLLFGGTALLPQLHDQLSSVLQESKKRGIITTVSTVYDFRNEKRAPGRRWPLGESTDSYANIDLLIVDREEALKLSGCTDTLAAAGRFTEWGVGALIITQGAESIILQAQGELFETLPLTEAPVCEAADRDLEAHPEKLGDTTGCGDNFVGGALAALAAQLRNSGRPPDLPTICAWGAASGGLACFNLGGTYIESNVGEKLAAVRRYVHAYAEQTKDVLKIKTDDL